MKTEPPAADVAAGMSVYATSGPRNDARIKVAEDDFLVEELMELGERADGAYPVYRVEKRGIDTLRAAEVLGEALRSRVSFAGLKDRRAVAVQYMSPTSKRSAAPAHVEERGMRAELVGRFSSPVSRGMMIGNRFRISVRGRGAGIVQSVEETYGKCDRRELPNFFGYQRFGLKADINSRVGRAILARDFGEAVSLLVGEVRIAERDGVAEARRLFMDGRYREALDGFARFRYPEERLVSRLLAKEGDYLGALRTLPLTLRRLFVNAYQSYIFNRVLSSAADQALDVSTALRGDNWARVAPDGLRVGRPHGVREDPPERALPLVQLVGYAFRNYGSRFDAMILKELSDEGMEPRQFYIKEAEEMSSEGGFRHAPMVARDLRYDTSPDRTVLDFSLAKGEYATTLLREIIKPERPLEAGF